MAVANYTDREKHFPPAYVLGPDGRPWHSWRVPVLPYLEQQPLFEVYRTDEPWDGPNNRTLAGRMPKLLAFHDTKFPTATTNYLAVVGDRTMWPGAVGREPADVTDGTANTVLIVENNGLGVHWMEPRDLLFDTMPFAVNDPAGVSSWYTHPAVATADGAVRRLSPKMSPEVLRAVLTVDGRESVEEVADGWTDLPDGRLRERAESK